MNETNNIISDNIDRYYVSTLGYTKPSMKQFTIDRISSGDFHLTARDAYELARWIVFCLKHFKGGIFRKGVNQVPLSQLRDDFMDANPQWPDQVVKQAFSPEIITLLGFRINNHSQD